MGVGVRSDSVLSMGELVIAGNSTSTEFPLIGEFVKAVGITHLCDCTQLVDMPHDNCLRYTGTSRKMFHTACSLSVKSNNANQQIDVMMYKSGAPLSDSLAKLSFIAPNSYESTALHFFLELDQNECLELWIANNTSTASVTVEQMNMFMMGM